MRWNGFWVAVFAAVALCACSDPKIDASSEANAAETIKAVRDALPEEQRKPFDDAVVELTVGESFAAVLSGKGAPSAGQMMAVLDGKTAVEVIAAAEAKRAERAVKEREQAIAEIKELQAKVDAAAKAVEQLKLFKIERSRLVQRKREYLGNQPVIELTVENGTALAVSRVYFRGTVASPGRSVPWIREDFNYEIAGGLEPGERAEWSLQPNMFSDWSTEVPADAILTVEVVRIDGPDGEAALSAEGLSEFEQSRLEELKKKFG